ncbi:MAG TPA: serine protease [Acetobacteraceae bacterium]|nr:serine protease [Acetobacteraceae bacterium]
MRAPLLACCLVVTTPALAEKPPPLGVPWNGPNAPAPPSGKPAPIEGDRAAPPSPRTGFSFNQPELPSPGERAASSGTGFVVGDGKVLTNRHVIADCSRVVARNSVGARLPARVQAADPERDLALLSVPASIGPPLTFRDVPPVRRGENVITYGFPLSGLLSSGPSLTTGNISALAGIRDNQGNFQISAAVQPGNSGGPLFDSRGNVIGVVVSKLNAARVAQLTGGDIPQNVNFAVKGTEALAFLRQNGIQPHVAASTGPEKRADEVDAVANPSTVYLQCFR